MVQSVYHELLGRYATPTELEAAYASTKSEAELREELTTAAEGLIRRARQQRYPLPPPEK